ncbi:MAG: SEC-C metal-binding domain-containing protein [Chlamydiales bacterium]|nr:SEC-C metal-binding domain-containing protein [Chlamydiales bacterium]
MEKAGRNDPCPCGSGLKYKQCCWGKPPKPKFVAKVIKSGNDAHKIPQMIESLHKPKEEKESHAFKMTDKDFRVTK